ncbi:hypothetical protein [Amycolatopsis sp. NPDC049868]|uniref:hypothetical protein n=1 Tax=Amycolatopsis sp. NPDC049868 TaxID=3363934 RepID=UPI003787B7DD
MAVFTCAGCAAGLTVPFGPPWRPWNEAEAWRLFAPVYSLSDGPGGSIVVAPGTPVGPC